MDDVIANWPGKSPVCNSGPEHPAVYHMLDVAAVAEVLIAPFTLTPGLRDALLLLTALHDLGKITAGFRNMLRTGQPQPLARHWEMTEFLLSHHDAILDPILGGGFHTRRALYAATAGHHGQPPTRDLPEHKTRQVIGAEGLQASGALITAFSDLWPSASLGSMRAAEAKQLSWWLAGLVTAADWIGSNTRWFPPYPAGPTISAYMNTARTNATRAVQDAGLAAPALSTDPLFTFALRPMQSACADVALPDGPSLVIIEDETGAGKTEAALILAQRMMAAGKGRGLYFALPTTATADAMFTRARDTVARMFTSPPSLTLAHGRAALSDDYRALQDPVIRATDEPVCTDWLADDRRRALLGTVGVGTIDQALLTILPTRFNTLRGFGLSSKILIVDEVHEMGEPYLSQELAQLLRLHRGQGGSAILLTATLPLDQRRALIAAWEAEDAGDPAYPALTVAGGVAVRDLPQITGPRGPVAVNRLPHEQAALDLLAEKAGQGAACLWVRNAVDDAIAGVQALRDLGIPATLLHARFTLADRLRHEQAALARFGKTGQGRAGQILVATQVVESSLDLDFDVMVSDLAPMAALVQRAGRLWRHMDLRAATRRTVPAPVLHVIAPDPDQVPDDQWLHRVLDKGAWVYPQDLQWRTARALFDVGQIVAPSGLRALIEAVHGAANDVPAPLLDAENARLGAGYAAANRARGNMVQLAEGYRKGGGAEEDTKYTTRLGRPTRALLLLGPDGRPVGGEGPAGWQRSEVQVAEHRLTGLDLPDQTTAAIIELTAGWPAWKRDAVTVCPQDASGRICAGLRYDPQLGLLFA